MKAKIVRCEECNKRMKGLVTDIFNTLKDIKDNKGSRREKSQSRPTPQPTISGGLRSPTVSGGPTPSQPPNPSGPAPSQPTNPSGPAPSQPVTWGQPYAGAGRSPPFGGKSSYELPKSSRSIFDIDSPQTPSPELTEKLLSRLPSQFSTNSIIILLLDINRVIQ